MIILLLLLATPIFAGELPLFSDSVIIIKGDGNIVYSIDETRDRGIDAIIDWGQIPDLGVPKDEIILIEITKRQAVKHDGSSIGLSPSEWIFTSPSWSIEYKGSIPYLENLEFLPEDYSVGTDNNINLIKNNMGYYQDSGTRFTGFYQLMHTHNPEAVFLIHILSAEENQYIYDMSRKLDTQIIQEQILEIEEKPVIVEELKTTETPVVETNDTNIDKNPKTETSVEKRENRLN